MPILRQVLFVFVLSVGLIGFPQAAPTPALSRGAPAYVENALWQATDALLSVIVTAESAQAAAAAVEGVGGSVTADLWLVEAAAATIQADRLQELARHPGVRSIVANQTVTSAQAPAPTDGWDGYVSNKMLRRSNQRVGGSALVGIATLPNGNTVALGNDGSLVYFDEAGSEVKRHQLSGNRLPFAPSAGGGVVLAIADYRLNAFDESGNPLWVASVSANEDFTSPAAVQGNRVFVTVDQRWVHAYDAGTGSLVWRTQVTEKNLGTPIGISVTGTGTVYVTFTGANGDGSGHLYGFGANGEIRFHMAADVGQYFQTPPILAANGGIFALSKRQVYSVGSNGAILYRFNLPDDLLATPAAGADGSLFVTVKSDKLIGINPNGSQRFEYRTGGSIVGAPALSPDGSRVYVSRKEKKLVAVDTTGGGMLWEYAFPDDLAAAPAVGTNGHVYVGDLLGTFAVVGPDGAALSRYTGFPPVVRAAVPTAQGAFLPGANGVSAITKLPKKWSGRADVIDIDEKKVWDLANPFTIDIGADMLHEFELPDGNKNRGRDVTIAVLDSGVYFTDQVKAEMGTAVQKLFLGQADFVDHECEIVGKGKKAYVIGAQFQSHCFTNAYASKDSYGHGTHVAGAIWNNMTDYSTGVYLGVAPEANILSVRVLDDRGNGTYADAIAGIQYIVQHKNYFGIRVLNMSISASPTTPYFVDPLNRAVMEAWAAGITVVAAAGNVGPLAESVTVPGNNPYVITVGAVDSRRTPGYWAGDMLPRWSAAGPTFDGFLKPDVLAPGSQIVSFMHNDHQDNSNSARLVQEHPDYSINTSLYRMNGTSMATAVTSGVVALMLQAHPQLTPDQVKYRLMGSALPAVTEEGAPLYNILQQGMGRIWAPAAVLAPFPAGAAANQGMDIYWDLSNGYGSPEELAGHYQGPARKMLSDDGATWLYYAQSEGGQLYGLGMVDASTGVWLDAESIGERIPTWSGGTITLNSGMNWAGGISLSAGMPLWSGGMPLWSGGMALWSGGMALWSGGMALWSGGMPLWSGNTGTWAEALPTWNGGMSWAGGMPLWSGGMALWSGGMPLWSGGMALWSGGMPLWSGGMAWAGSEPTWSGGMPLWSGGMPLWSGSTQSSSLGANEWVDDDDAYKSDDDEDAANQTNPPAQTAEPAPAPQPAPQPAPTPEPAPAPAPVAQIDLHVSDLDNYSYWQNKKKWVGAFVVEISSVGGEKVAGGLVTVSVEDGSGDNVAVVQCTTNGQGSCLITTSPQNSNKVNRMVASVQDVALSGYGYNAAANSDPDGDSNGTSITSYLPSPSATQFNGPNSDFSGSTALATLGNADAIDDSDADEPEQMNRIFLPSIGNGR